MASSMFSKESVDQHIGDEVKYRDSLYDLKEVESYFKAKCKEVGIECTHDCTAEEKATFKTLSYTTYAGLFYIHPLSFAVSEIQVTEAAIDNCEPVGHIEWLRKRIEAKCQGKYTLGTGDEMKKSQKAFTDVLVPAGSNKFKQHVSGVKFKRLIKAKGENLVIKPHPLTNLELLGRMFKDKGDAYLAHPSDDIYSYIENAETVHTTHISETALISLLMGKRITPIDPFNNRMHGGFSTFNNICFNYENPIETLDKAFASYKSGVVHPEIDSDWKGKIDKYIDYIMAKRKQCRGYYYGS